MPPQEPLAAGDSAVFLLPPDEPLAVWDSAVFFLPPDEPLAWDSAVFFLPPHEAFGRLGLRGVLLASRRTLGRLGLRGVLFALVGLGPRGVLLASTGTLGGLRLRSVQTCHRCCLDRKRGALLQSLHQRGTQLRMAPTDGTLGYFAMLLDELGHREVNVCVQALLQLMLPTI